MGAKVLAQETVATLLHGETGREMEEVRLPAKTPVRHAVVALGSGWVRFTALDAATEEWFDYKAMGPLATTVLQPGVQPVDLHQALAPLEQWARLALARLDAEGESPALDSLTVLRVENGGGKAVVTVGELRAFLAALEVRP